MFNGKKKTASREIGVRLGREPSHVALRIGVERHCEIRRVHHGGVIDLLVGSLHTGLVAGLVPAAQLRGTRWTVWSPQGKQRHPNIQT